MLSNRLAICMFFYSKNTNFLASARQSAPFFKAKLTRTKQLIDHGLKYVFSACSTNSFARIGISQQVYTCFSLEMETWKKNALNVSQVDIKNIKVT